MTNPMFVIKYSNRRMYSFNTTKRVTLKTIMEAVEKGQAVVVKDKDTGNDITQETLIKAYQKYAPNQLRMG